MRARRNECMVISEIFFARSGQRLDWLLELHMMRRFRTSKTRPLSLALALVLLIAQTGALTHAYEHALTGPQSQVCSICIAANTMGSACVDSGPELRLQPAAIGTRPDLRAPFRSVRTQRPCQRAPPSLY